MNTPVGQRGTAVPAPSTLRSKLTAPPERKEQKREATDFAIMLASLTKKAAKTDALERRNNEQEATYVTARNEKHPIDASKETSENTAVVQITDGKSQGQNGDLGLPAAHEDLPSNAIIPQDSGKNLTSQAFTSAQTDLAQPRGRAAQQSSAAIDLTRMNEITSANGVAASAHDHAMKPNAARQLGGPEHASIAKAHIVAQTDLAQLRGANNAAMELGAALQMQAAQRGETPGLSSTALQNSGDHGLVSTDPTKMTDIRTTNDPSAFGHDRATSSMPVSFYSGTSLLTQKNSAQHRLHGLQEQSTVSTLAQGKSVAGSLGQTEQNNSILPKGPRDLTSLQGALPQTAVPSKTAEAQIAASHAQTLEDKAGAALQMSPSSSSHMQATAQQTQAGSATGLGSDIPPNKQVTPLPPKVDPSSDGTSNASIETKTGRSEVLPLQTARFETPPQPQPSAPITKGSTEGSAFGQSNITSSAVKSRKHDGGGFNTVDNTAPKQAEATTLTTHSTAANPAIAAATTKPAMSLTDSMVKSDIAHSLLVSSESLEVFNWDSGKPISTPTGNYPPLRSDLAPHIARQLAEALPQAANRPVEIALSPAELGRVRMSILAEDGSITVNIIAERGDTLDLMRRHIEQLGQTFRSMGYDQINFAFGQGSESGNQSQNNGSEGASTGNAGTQSDAGDTPNIINLNSAPDGGVDIRL